MRAEIQREIEIIVETIVVLGRFVDLDNPATLALKAEGQCQSREQKELYRECRTEAGTAEGFILSGWAEEAKETSLS